MWPQQNASFHASFHKNFGGSSRTVNPTLKFGTLSVIYLINIFHRITNPLLYKHVDEAIKEPTPDKWTKKLPAPEQETIAKRVEKAKAEWNAAYESRLSYVPQRLARNFGPWADLNRASSHHVSVWDTGVEREQLRYVLAKSVQVPEEFKLHGQLDRHKKQRLEAAQTGLKIDWGCAEAMAFGTLLQVNLSR